MSSRLIDRRTNGLLIAALLAGPLYAHAGQTTPAGTIVNVSTEADLQSAVQDLRSNTTIVLAPGTYVLTRTLQIHGALTDVGIRGATQNFDDVTLVGGGMSHASYGSVPDGIETDGQVHGLTIANLGIRNIYRDAIAFGAGAARPHVYNVHLVDAGRRFIESAADGTGGVANALVEGSVFEFTGTARDTDARGIEVFAGVDWIVRDNIFRNIVGPSRQMAGPALVLSRGSRNTITERNSFVNVTTGVAYGVRQTADVDHAGGAIRNNFFFRTGTQPGESAIVLADSPDTAVVNNTVFLSGTYGVSIEYRFPGTTGVLLANNLVDGIIAASDGATGTERNNLAGATAGLFIDATAGDLRLGPAAIAAIDRGATLAGVTDDWSGRLRPAGRAYDIGAHEYGADRAAYAIRGRVIDARSNTGAAGVTVTLSGARAQSVTTDTDGSYLFSGLAGRVDYTATPSAAGRQMTPASLFFAALNGSQDGADFSAWAPASDAPRVTTAANRAPTVSVTSPADGDVFTAPASITITANARDRETSVSKVAFYAGSTLIGTDTSSPFKVTWSNVTAGSYTLTAVATDTQGASTTSNPITIQVKAASAPRNQAPTVSMTAPASGAVYTAPASMTVSASASDSDGSVVKVDFYAGSTLIGTKTGSPYQITWSSVAAGTYSLTAVATDNSGTTTRSSGRSVSVSAPASPAPPNPAPPVPSESSSGMWIPPLSTTWQWQLTGQVDQTVDAAMFDIDLFDNDAAVVAGLHAKGRHVVCYISAGTWEDWRPDASQFPASVKGSTNGWPGEKWLDIRQLSILAPIMSARLDLCKQKGFDAIEPDNIDGYTNKTGFPLTAQDQIAYNMWLAAAAHSRGMSIGLKNDIDQVNDLVGAFDWALNEQCFQYNECSTLTPFIKAGKAVFQVEYSMQTPQFCPKAVSMQFNSMKKNLDLDVPRTACTP
jgi:hypothetical protein